MTTNQAGNGRAFSRRSAIRLGGTALAAAAIFTGTATKVAHAAVKRQTFDNGADGVEITAANSSGSGDALALVNKVGTGIARYRSAAMIRGLRGAHVTGVSGDGLTMALSATAASTASAQLYFSVAPGGMPVGGNWNICRLRSASANAAVVIMTPAGMLMLQNAVGVGLKNFYGGAALPAGRYYIDIQVTRGTSTANGSISAQLHDAATEVLIDSYSASNVNAGVLDISQFQFGKLTGAGSVSAYLDAPAFETGSTTPIGPLPGFIVGQTKPAEGVNAGVISTPTVTYSGPHTLAGSTDPANPTLIENKIISTRLVITSGYVRIVNCLVTAPAPAAVSTGQIFCNDLTDGRVHIFRCTFRPSTMSWYLDGVQGHHWTVEQCVIERVVDGCGSMNKHGGRSDNYLLGSVVRNLSWWDYDGIHFGDTPGTHNDGVQHHGGAGLWIIGNLFEGYKHNVLGSPALDGSANNRHPQIGQIVLTTHTDKYVDDIHVNYNWIRGGDSGVKFYTVNGFGGTRATYDVECVGNRWIDDDQRQYSGTYGTYQIRIDSNVRLNGSLYAGNSWTLDTHGNVYADVPEIDIARRGKAVYVACDAV